MPGVIFDMDGVFVDSGPPHLESWQIVARQHGIDVTAERFLQTFGRPSRDIIRIIWGGNTSDEDVQRIDDEKEAAYRELVRGRVPLMPGCRETLARLADAGLKLAVATSGPRENLELVLHDGDIAEYFTATVTGFDVSAGKPAPDCFLLAAERIACQPRECVVIEDAPVGVRAAVAAEMPCIALRGTHEAEPLRDAGATRCVASLTEISPVMIRDVLGGRAQ